MSNRAARNRKNQLGARTHESEFTPYSYLNGFKGIYYKAKEDGSFGRAALIVQTDTLNSGIKELDNDQFREITEEEYKAILEKAGAVVVEDMGFTAREDKTTSITLFAANDERDAAGNLKNQAMRLQSDFYGVKIGGRVLSPKCELQVFLENTVNWHNNAYRIKKKTDPNFGEWAIKGERGTKRGVRCLFYRGEDGEIAEKHALYMSERVFFTNETTKDGELYSNFTPKDALAKYQELEEKDALANDFEPVQWEYDVDVCLAVGTLLNTYKEEGITVHKELDDMVNRDVFNYKNEDGIMVSAGADAFEAYDTEAVEVEAARDWIAEIEAVGVVQGRKLAVESGELSASKAATLSKVDLIKKMKALLD